MTDRRWLLLLLAGFSCGGSPGRDGAADAVAVDAGGGDRALPPPPQAEPGRHEVEVLDTRRIVPSPGLPPEAVVARANNNLDVVRHDDGRVYLAWRSAPDHFASPDVAIHVVSSDDEQSWRHEATFRLGTDLREPRLLSLQGTLFLHVALLGTDPLAFEPRGTARAEKPAGGGWSQLADLGWPPYIVWRTRMERGTPYLLRYLGGEHIYRFDGVPLAVELLTSTDGRSWTAVDPARPVVWRGGGSEADFTLGDDGTAFAVIRNEAGDEAGYGSRICRAAAGQLAAWTCRSDPRKFDSPLMFWHDGEAYLVARRNLTDSGAFDLGRPDLDPVTRVLGYQFAYQASSKRCSLWRYLPADDRIGFVTDLPSRGDTCFPAWLPGPTADTVIVYDYSSAVDGPELTWGEGQRGPTFVYRHLLRFRRR